MRFLARLLWLAAAVFLAASSAVRAQDYATNPPPLITRLTPEVLERVYPGAGRLEASRASPPVVIVHDAEDNVAGWIFSTLDLLHARGYVVTPFDVVGGVTVDGTLTGAMMVWNRESYVNGNERRTEMMQTFLSGLMGMPFSDSRSSRPPPNFVSGATISSTAMRAAVGDAARVVMRTVGGLVDVTVPTLDTDRFRPRTVEQLLADGSITTMSVTTGELASAIDAAGLTEARLVETSLRGEPDATWIRLNVGVATTPTIGRNIVDQATLDRIRNEFPRGTVALVVGSDGRFDFMGSRYRNESSGYALDRFEVVQGDRTYSFTRAEFIRIGVTPLGTYTGLVMIRPNLGFDPLQPFTANLRVHLVPADGVEQTLAFPLGYQIPEAYILRPLPPPVPAWVETWQNARVDIIILAAALTILTLIFVFQDRLTRYRRVHRWVRNVFLLFTLVWLGYVAGGQLSIIHISNFIKAPFENVDIGFYLAEPLIIIVAVYAAISLILIGRGVFCGWLCPFGALQEFAFKIGRFLKLPEINPSARVQKWMWLPKYGIAAFILGTAFIAPEVSAATTEVEPFKTAITSAFTRPWPYITYAVLLLAIGMFSERAYCRFLCPLGATFALLDRLHLVNLLKRRPECGSPCHLCERSCPVKAITPAGKIITSECFQCLDCQVEYHDDQRCPPLAKDRKKRLREAARPAGIGQPVPTFARQITQ